jgi:hypothetical protein
MGNFLCPHWFCLERVAETVVRRACQFVTTTFAGLLMQLRTRRSGDDRQPQGGVSLNNTFDSTAWSGINPAPGGAHSTAHPPSEPTSSRHAHLATPIRRTGSQWNRACWGMALQLGYIGSEGTKPVRLRAISGHFREPANRIMGSWTSWRDQCFKL